jgi:6-phosphogluconolactonase (cycloisomerase 2 family)
LINATTGVLAFAGNTAVTSGPKTLEIDPTNSFLYVSTISGGAGGRLEAFSINSTTGALVPLLGSPLISPSATPPSSLRMDPTGKFLLSGHYAASGQSQVDVYSVASTGVPTLITDSPFNICTGILTMAMTKLY